jgi:hypothetical protein
MERFLKFPKNEAADSQSDCYFAWTSSLRRFEKTIASKLKALAQHFSPEVAGIWKAQADAAFQAAKGARITATEALPLAVRTYPPGDHPANKEPRCGQCDAIVTLSIPDILDEAGDTTFTLTTQPSKMSRRDDIKFHEFLRAVAAENPDDLLASAILHFPATGYGLPSPTFASGSVAPTADQNLASTFPTRAMASLTLGVSDMLNTDAMDDPRSLQLPLLAIEHKKFTNDGYKPTGVIQGRFYAVAMVKFLAAIGIKRFPVFTLITEGSIGVLTCAFTDAMVVEEDQVC